ncbi:hypothetical protein ACH5RR_014888 [Cinchona calisaya]|uniref:Late embryogenesis abundant protein LEA-2 subgroup domain-containing protein n=1 Tax=Cinchona calisaya TaxID=153742 RepID=A0ABD2ZRJ8_9GENT
MSSPYQLPIQTNHPTVEHRPVKRHHSARYYAHRVRESLTTRVSKFICSVILFILFFIGLIAFIMWLSLRPHRPRILVQDFSIPAISQQNGFENAQINFNVTARNPNRSIGIYYDEIHVAISYDDQNIGGNSLLFPFYQQPENSTFLASSLSGTTLTVNDQIWKEFLADQSQGRVIFKLEVTSNIRFKIMSWESKHHTLHANCPVGVGPDGIILLEYKDKRCPVYFS